MEETPNLRLPFILEAQAQKHVTHNEAIRALDAIVQLGVQDKGLSTPPADPVEAQRHIVGEGGEGEWAGHDQEIAAFQDGAWAFFAPTEGWIAWVNDEAQLYVWSESSWTTISGGDFQSVPILGINADADDTNRLSVNANATLLNHDGAGHQVKINKNSNSDTASFTLQTGFSGRAEFGTIGDDDFTLNISPDGSTYLPALIADKDTASVTLPQHPKFQGKVNYNQYIGIATWTNVDINTLEHNDQGAVDAGVFTAPHDGFYHIGGAYGFLLNHTLPGGLLIGLSYNGGTPDSSASETVRAHRPVVNETSISTEKLFKLSAGDTVSLQAFFETNDGFIQGERSSFWGVQVA